MIRPPTIVIDWRMVVILGDYKFTIIMIKSSYTGNKKENIFSVYKFQEYKKLDFALAMVRVNGFTMRSELLRKCSDKIIEIRKNIEFTDNVATFMSGKVFLSN